MSIYVPAESSARIQVAIAETVRRQVERKALRAQMATARRIGLDRRHKIKLRREESAMATRRNPPSDDDADRLAELARLAQSASKGAAREETETERYLRVTDQALQSAMVNLRRLRDISAARDALKLVRQAQNLVMDAQDDGA